MFETVNKRSRRAGSKMSAGALGSLIVHAILVVVIVILSTREAKPTQKKAIDYSQVTFKDIPVEPPAPPPMPELANLPPPPPPPPPPAAAATPVNEIPKVPKKPKKQVQSKPNTMVAAPVDPNPAPPEPVAGGVPGGVEGGVEGGVVGGKIGGVPGGVIGGTGDVPVQNTNAVLPFGAGMERPRKLRGRDPEFSAQALAAGVDGLMIVRCVIELDGKLEECKVLKSLPYMEDAVLSALKTHEYSPVMFQGRPQRVNYTFNIRLVAPK